MYKKYFGLSRKPFNATPDPWFHYTNRAYQEAYATLLYGIQERKGFIALIGEVGTGKTTLLRRLMDNMNPAIKAVFVHNTLLTFDELVEFICAELEISVSGVARLARLQALNRFLIAEAKRGGTVVLLLDEAQNLSAEALENLRLISNLETATDKLLQIVLAGQPELEAKLADPALRQLTQRIALRFRLEPLDDSEVEPYVDYRLRVVGRSRRELFTDKAIRKLIPYVHGIPRLINVICDNALVLAYATDRQRVTGQMIDSVVTDLRLEPPRPPAAGRSAPAKAPARPERDLAALWNRESSEAGKKSGSGGTRVGRIAVLRRIRCRISELIH
jgi:general secretion pathway protein A